MKNLSLDEVLAENLRNVLRTLNFSTSALAEKVGVSQKTISNIINCNHSAKIDTLEKIAAYLKRPPGDLLTKNLGNEPVTPPKPLVKVPLMDKWESAPKQREEFELVVMDASMVGPPHIANSYRPGCILLFQPVQEIKPGSLYLFKLRAVEKPVFGEYYESETGFKIHFFNDANSDILVDESNPGEVIAELKQSRMRYDLN